MAKQFNMPTSVDECASLSFDDCEVFLEKEKEAVDTPSRMALAKWAIERAYGEDVFLSVKKSNRDVNGLMALITQASFGLTSEIKNFVRSGNGEPTWTD